MRWMRALPVFSIAFPLLYLPAMYFNLPVFTYVPKTHEFHAFLFQPAGKLGPGMFYYGWLVTAGIAAAAIALAAAYAPEKAIQRIPASLVWIAPLAVIAALLDILSDWFTR
ncbi:MAG TPA: hypothetical protein VN802_01740 [Stellaceae bacterium]|nr:hypothetical protein [Stellaceae bacterium]